MSLWHRYNQSRKVEPVAGEKKYRIIRLFIKWYFRISIAMFLVGMIVGMISAVHGLTE